MQGIETKEKDPLHPYSVDELLAMIKRKAIVFQYKVRIRSHDLEHLERINHSLDKHIAKQFQDFMLFYARLYGFTDQNIVDLKAIGANLVSLMAKENCFV